MKDIDKPRFDGPIAIAHPEPDHPLRKKTDAELHTLIKEKISLENAIHDNPALDKVLIECRIMRETAEAILQGRKKK